MNRRALAVALFLLPAILGGCASIRYVPSAPDRHIRIAGGSAPVVFLPGETVVLNLDTTGIERARTLSVEILDFRGEPCQRFEWDLQTLEKKPDRLSASKTESPGVSTRAPGDPLVVYIRRPSDGETLRVSEVDMPQLGVFRVHLKASDATGAVVAEEETTFARIRDVSLKTRRPDSPFGIGAYYAVRFNPDELAVASRMQQLLGAAWDRDELLWDIVEPEPGKWTWEKTDRAVRAARERNIDILGLLDYWGKWAKPFTDEGYAAYANYVTRLVSRYKPGGEFALQEGWTDGYGIRHWEIWNEPATFWSGSGQQFGRLMKAAHDAAKAADPNCRVFFSEAGPDFNKAALQESGADALDGVTPHYYCPPRSPEEGGIDKNMKKTVEDFAALGVKGKPFWVSEFGWPTTMGPGQMRNQADYLVRSHVYGLAAGLDKFFWYNFMNDNADKNAQHYGLVNREDWTPRFGYGAYAAMVHFLDGARFVQSVDLVRPARIFVFSTGSGSVAVLWSSGAEGSLRAPLPPGAELFDMMSNSILRAGLPKSFDLNAAPTRAHKIPLTGDPVYLVAPGVNASGLAALLAASVIEGISSAEVRVLPLVGPVRDGASVRVNVTNLGRAPIDGTVAVIPPAFWRTASGGIQIPVGAIAPDTEQTIVLNFVKTEATGDNRYPFRAIFRDAAGNEAVGESMLSELIAPKGTATIDGDPGDWEGIPFVHLDTPDKAVGLVPYMDWNLSADVATMWDAENFYFVGVVKDNAFNQTHSGSTMWEGDSFQIAFDTRPNRATADAAGDPLHRPEPSNDTENKGLYLYGLSHTPKGDEAWAWSTPGSPRDQSASSIRFAFRPLDKDLYVYEAAIPKALLSPLEFREGEEFGFSLLLNDNDGGGRRGWLELTPGIGTGYEPKRFVTWTLGGSRK